MGYCIIGGCPVLGSVMDFKTAVLILRTVVALSFHGKRTGWKARFFLKGIKSGSQIAQVWISVPGVAFTGRRTGQLN